MFKYLMKFLAGLLVDLGLDATMLHSLRHFHALDHNKRGKEVNHGHIDKILEYNRRKLNKKP